ncbi:hypothetical protein JCM19239_2428 [Vibrio variabilis]|uniref:Uncharacterized protein n=1 Tax=Vibrio variabilis TaxID=990271 RepID=A0ABQ0JK11_9VIBR|nr:hypothetical protein JCM19239_2428 [Vibrio variabilis]
MLTAGAVSNISGNILLVVSDTELHPASTIAEVNHTTRFSINIANS